MDRHVDVAVIGGGLAGLTAAATAAREGARVLVLDARQHVGGRARTAERGGFLVNEGPHALYRDGEGMRVLRALGVRADGAVPPAAGATGLLDGALGLLPSGPVSLVRTPLLGRRGKWQVGRLLAGLRRARPELLAHVPVRRWVDDTLSDANARQLLHAIVRVSTYANDPEASAAVAVTQVQRVLAGSVLYLHGGWQQLVDALVALGRTAGVEIAPSAKVAAVRTDSRHVEVDVDGRSVLASAVIVAAGGPRAAAELLGPGSGIEDALMRPATVAVLDVCLAGEWGDHPTFVLGIDQPTYLSVHAPLARLAPAGCSMVSVMRYLAPGETAEAAVGRRELEAFLDLARPRWRDDVTHAEYRRCLVAAHDIPSAARGGVLGRPTVDTAAPGVFLAGDWVGREGVLADAALASGAAAGRAAARAARGLAAVA